MATTDPSAFQGSPFIVPRRFGVNVEDLFPPATGVVAPGATNFDTLHDGKMIPAFDHITMTNSGDLLNYAVDHTETTSPTGNPRSYVGGSKTVYYHEDGTRTADNVFADVVDGLAIGDSGTADQVVGGGGAKFTAGTKALLAGFGNSASVACAIRQLGTDTTPWTVQTNTATYAQFWSIVLAGRDLYAVTNGGTTVLGEYHVSVCPAGNDPTRIAGWGGGVAVGGPEWQINKLAPFGDSVVAAKPDGLYYYDLTTKRFRNMLQFISPHGANGKACHVIPNGVLYDTFDGKLWFFDGTEVAEVTPWKNYVLTRDVKQGRISAVASNGTYVAVAIEANQNTTQGMGMTVVTYINGTFTDVTSTVTDGKLATGAAMATWGAAANDMLLIGADTPWEAAQINATVQFNAAAQNFNTPSYSNGTAGTVAPFNTSFTAFTAGRDGTTLNDSTKSLVAVGFPPSSSAGVLGWTDINAFDLMTKSALTMAGVNSGNPLSKYWVRWMRTSANGMTNPTRIDEVSIIPSRAGMPNTGIMTTTTNFTHRDRAGCLTHIYLGRPQGTTAFTWNDVYTLDTGGGVTSMGWTTGRPGVLNNGGQQLIVWGRYKQMLIMDSQTRDGSRTYVPKLKQYNTSGPGPLYPLSPTTLQDPYVRKTIKYVLIDGEYGQNVDVVDLYYSWDHAIDIKLFGTGKGLPCVFPPPAGFQSGGGRVLRLWLAYQDTNQTDITAPFITRVSVFYEYPFEELDLPQDLALATPETD